MSEEREIMFLVAYQCPHCRSPLESRAGRAEGWVRCPSCGRAGRPPEQAVAPRPPRRHPAADDLLVIGPEPELSRMTPVAVAPYPGGRPTPTPDDRPATAASPFRVVCATALFVSVTLLLFAVLEQSATGMSVLSAAAVLFLVLLALPARGHGRDG